MLFCIKIKILRRIIHQDPDETITQYKRQTHIRNFLLNAHTTLKKTNMIISSENTITPKHLINTNLG